MNRKSIFGILLLILALSLTLGAVSAEDIATDEPAASAAGDVVTVDENAAAGEPGDDAAGHASGGDVSASSSVSNVSKADVGVVVTPLLYDDLGTVWSVFAYNLGPDTAVNTMVSLGCSDNLALYDYYALSGLFDPVTGIWYIGDLKAGEYTELLLDMVPIDEGPYYVDAKIASDTFDPDLSNNYDIGYMGLSASAAEETLPATGNPLAMALLALIAVGVCGIRRRF